MRPSALVLIPGVALVVACAIKTPASDTLDTQAIAKTLDSLDARQQDWFARGIVDSIATGFYAPDAMLMQSGSAALQGKDAIRAGFADLLKSADVRIKFAKASRQVSESLAVEQGRYNIEIRAKSDTAKVVGTDHGSYVTAFVKRNGQWRAIYDISSSEIPVPMPAAAPASATKK